MDDIKLIVNGTAYDKWKEAMVQISINQMAGAFAFQAADRYAKEASKWNMSLGDECQITVNGTAIATGYIDDMPLGYDANSHNFRVGGRDKTADLVDCSYDGPNMEWKNLPASSIIKNLINPFSIALVIDSSVTSKINTKIPKFSANAGDTVFSLIDKLCKMLGVLPISLGDGKLTLTEAGTISTYDRLQVGVNTKSGQLKQTNRERYSHYIVKGQGIGGDLIDLESSIGPSGTFEDPIVTRYRPLVILADTIIDSGKAKKQAEWEARRRAGKSRAVEYTVQGWSQSNKEVWPLNSLVKVKDDELDIQDNFLISGLTFSLNEASGTTTIITVEHPSAYALLADAIGIKTSFDNNGFDFF